MSSSVLRVRALSAPLLIDYLAGCVQTKTTPCGLNGMVLFDSGWNIVSPQTYANQFDNPLPLAVGPATMSVTSPTLVNTNDNLEGDQTSIPIEIYNMRTQSSWFSGNGTA